MARIVQVGAQRVHIARHVVVAVAALDRRALLALGRVAAAGVHAAMALAVRPV
jgi:hypothetical protein